MASRSNSGIAQKLMIKYGLPGHPNETEISTWRDRTNQLIALGRDREEAGRAAAKETFTGFETHVYASEADDILSLLDAAGDR